jgi:hypothetical protein
MNNNHITTHRNLHRWEQLDMAKLHDLSMAWGTARTHYDKTERLWKKNTVSAMSCSDRHLIDGVRSIKLFKNNAPKKKAPSPALQRNGRHRHNPGRHGAPAGRWLEMVRSGGVLQKEMDRRRRTQCRSSRQQEHP